MPRSGRHAGSRRACSQESDAVAGVQGLPGFRGKVPSADTIQARFCAHHATDKLACRFHLRGTRATCRIGSHLLASK